MKKGWAGKANPKGRGKRTRQLQSVREQETGEKKKKTPTAQADIQADRKKEKVEKNLEKHPTREKTKMRTSRNRRGTKDRKSTR